MDKDTPIADTPITKESEDKLRLRIIAEQLSKTLDLGISEGFVIGVEGSWGSGKSSLINLALKELKKPLKRVASSLLLRIFGGFHIITPFCKNIVKCHWYTQKMFGLAT
ncbi:MAG: P-loop NTPase fold protein, partial [Gammaproteobacteria bacterium]|nr:P-loop NTPase fold protein [Gammaproteobacteria bacterium]